MLESCLSILNKQLIQAEEDLKKLEQLQKRAHEDPNTFISDFLSKKLPQLDKLNIHNIESNTK